MSKVFLLLLPIWVAQASNVGPQHQSFLGQRPCWQQHAAFASSATFGSSLRQPWQCESDRAAIVDASNPHKNRFSAARSNARLQHATRLPLFMQLDPGTAAFLCGSIAGVTSSFAVFPVDTAKTKMQTASSKDEKEKYSSISKSISEVFHESGLSGLFRGCGPALLGSAPEAAIQMTAHDTTYSMLASMPNAPSIFLMHTLAGAAAGFFTILATNPLEVLKIRGQVGEPEEQEAFRGALERCSELFRGCHATWLRDIPFYATYFPIYDAAKGASDSALVAGLMAGVLATLITTPADLIKTRIQAREAHGAGGAGERMMSQTAARGYRDPRPSMLVAHYAARWDAGGSGWGGSASRAQLQAARAPLRAMAVALAQWVEEGRRLVAEGGVRGLYAGCEANVARKGAAMAISLSVYEALHAALLSPVAGARQAAVSQVVQSAALAVPAELEGTAESIAESLAGEVPAVVEAVGAIGQAAVSAAVVGGVL